MKLFYLGIILVVLIFLPAAIFGQVTDRDLYRDLEKVEIFTTDRQEIEGLFDFDSTKALEDFEGTFVIYYSLKGATLRVSYSAGIAERAKNLTSVRWKIYKGTNTLVVK